MINLSSLNDILNAEQQQQVQDSTLAQKVTESAAQPKQYNLSPEAQSIVDEVQADRERELIRRRLMAYQDAMMQDTVNRFAGGSGIHIDPSKRGTFTAAASRHGMGVQEFASHVHAHPENYSPAMRRKANFARNAAKWSHAYGGNVYAPGGEIINEDQMAMKGWQWKPYSALSPDDPLYGTITDQTDNYIVDQNGRIVPRSEIESWANSYEAQLPYQPQSDVALRHEILNEQRRKKEKDYENAIKQFYWTAGNVAWAVPVTRYFVNSGLANGLESLNGVVEDGPFKGFPTTASEWNRAFNTNPHLYGRIHRAIRHSSIPDKVASGFDSLKGHFNGELDRFTLRPELPFLNSPSIKMEGHFDGAGGGAEWGDEDVSQTPQPTSLSDVPVVHTLLDNPAENINSYAYGDYIDPNTSIYDALRMAGIPFRTSNPSGYRGPGNYVGKARDKSAHAKRRKDGTAYALDITGDFNKIRRMINASKPLQNYFAANGFGVHEELTKEALRKTGGTGPHFHIGLLSGKDVHDSGKNSSGSYAQADPSTGGYLDTSQPGMQVLATFDPSSAQDSFTPWWQRVAQTDENFLAQQVAGAAGGAYDLAQFTPSWMESERSSSTFPYLFAEGGYLMPVHPYAIGDEISYGPYNLNTLEVTPTAETYSALNNLHSAVRNKRMRNQLVEYLMHFRPTDGYSQQDRINRFVQVWNAADRPTIGVKSKGWDIGNIFNAGRDRAITLSSSYISGPNSILIGNHDDAGKIMEEMGHAYHDSMARKGLVERSDSVPLFPDMKQNGKPGYDRENHYEYQAHRIVNPRLIQYITGAPMTKDKGSYNTLKDLRNRVNTAVKAANKTGRAKGYY